MRMSMRILILPILLCVGLTACGGGDSSQSRDAATIADGTDSAGKSAVVVADHGERQQARAAVNRLGMALKKELSQAMKEGGPEAALHVCNTKAAEVTEAVCSEAELDISRVSSRWRNPANAPDAQEAAVLAAFESNPSHGDTLVSGADGAILYMKPIRVQSPLCLKCHGNEAELAPGVSERLAALYPEDLATGFSEGDLRGAFSVRFPLSSGQDTD